MIAPIEINRVTVKGGAGMPTSEYAQLVYKGEEIGFISIRYRFKDCYYQCHQ